MSQLLLKRDSALTKKAKDIFGAIVKDAYLIVDIYDNRVDPKEVTESLRNKRDKFVSKENRIDYDGDVIVITFINNRSVFFTNSEWASITTIDINKGREKLGYLLVDNKTIGK